MFSISELVPHTETVYCAAEMTPPEIEFCVHEHTISETIPRYCDCALGLLGEFWARTATVPVPCKICCMLCWAAPTTSVSKVSYMCNESWHPWASADSWAWGSCVVWAWARGCHIAWGCGFLWSSPSICQAIDGNSLLWLATWQATRVFFLSLLSSFSVQSMWWPPLASINVTQGPLFKPH